jgi:hypothetical protein
MQAVMEREPVYVLGHSDDDLRRLEDQSRLFDTLTERLRDEVVSANAVVVSPALVGAWVRKAK